MEKLVNKLFGEDLTHYLLALLDTFQERKYTEKEVYSSIQMMNESVRNYLLGLAYDKKMEDYVELIYSVNQKLKGERIEKFKKAIKKGEAEKFLVMLSRVDKISLLDDLHLLNKNTTHFSKEEKEIILLVENSIRESQGVDKRNGIQDFLTYQKN